VDCCSFAGVDSLDREEYPDAMRVFAALGLVAIAGCHAASVCEPPGSTSGVIVAAKNSAAYAAEMDKAESDVPHVACRAETTVETTVVYFRGSEPLATGSADRGPKGIDSSAMGQGKSSDTTPLDSRLLVPRDDMHRFEGQYRILGVGRGIDDDDCAGAAMLACNEATDLYYRKRNAVRPIGVPCRVLEDRDRCPGAPGGRRAVVAAAPQPERNEPPLASLVHKLDDDRTRADAVRGIVQFFENAKARANGELGHADVKALVDRVIDPMTKTYADAKLDDATRGALIRFLAETRDARAGRAWIKALGSDDDVEWGALGIGATAYREGAAALGEAFTKLEAGTPKGSKASKSVRTAMLALKDPVWKAILLERVGRSLQKPDGASEAAKTAYQNEVFWQATSAEVLGELHDGAATRALLKVLLDPAKTEVVPAALAGLLAIGKSAVPALLDVLAGKDTELVAFAKSTAADQGGNAKAYVAAAALALGEIGRADARDALARATRSADHDANRAALALALTKVATSADAEKAFQTTYEKLAPGAMLAFSKSAARPALLDAAAGFHDASLVPWLLRQIAAAKGADAEEVRAAGLRSALLLMKTTHAPAMRQAVDKLGGETAKEAFGASTRVLESCDAALDCYAAKLDAPSGNESAKAAAMLGALGETKTASTLVERLPRIPTAEGRRAALAALDHLVRADGAGIADSLEAMENELADERGAVHRVVLRLRAR
jgi:hypothetical protein